MSKVAEYFDPTEDEEGAIRISPARRKLHERTELASAVLAAPFMLYLASRNRPLNDKEKAGLVVLGVCALMVDTTLYMRFRRAKRRRRR